MTTTLAAPNSTTQVRGSNGNLYTAVNGLITVSAAADIAALVAVGCTPIAPYTSLASIPVNKQTGTSYQVVPSDQGSLVTFNNASAVSVLLPAPSVAFANGWSAYVGNLGAGSVTITPTSPATIGGASSLGVTTNDAYLIVSDGTNYRTLVSNIA